MLNFNADHSWFGLLEVVVLVLGTGAFSVATAVITGRLTARHVNKPANEKLDEIKDTVEAIGGQVVNGHTDPMRTELDRYFAGINDRLDKQDESLASLHTAIKVEQGAREAVNQATDRRLEAIERNRLH